jgi:hypothetical protein
METKGMEDKLIKTIKNKILLRDILWKLKIFPPTFLLSIIFKDEINPVLLGQEGYKVIKLLKNPYLNVTQD